MPFVYGYNGERITDGFVDNIVMEKLDFDKQLSHLEIQTVDDNFIAWRTLHVNWLFKENAWLDLYIW